ncbi:MAG: hypothetical protein ACD_41C00152G0002 [uncultured bacterium]|nr:MAG: hypothetical protein ACD_41C00152G0002 [uncultured bacterium]
MYITNLNTEFEKAVRFITRYLPASDENSRKPVLFHSIRVGVYLYENGYGRDIVLSGILHDVIEWSEVNEQMLKEEFGDAVTKLVLANTKDDSIVDQQERTNELIRRCVQNGRDAFIVKTADIIDSFKWYTIQGNKEELKNHCVRNATAIFKFKPKDFNDKIFEELNNLQEQYESHN